MYKKAWCTWKVVVLRNKPFAFLTSSLPSPSSLLKLPIVTIVDLSWIIVSIIIIITIYLTLTTITIIITLRHHPLVIIIITTTFLIHIISIIINSNDTGIMTITMTTWIMAIWSFKKIFKSQQLCYCGFYILLGAWWRVTVWMRRFLNPWPPFLLLLKCKPENKQTKNKIYLTLLN